MDVNIKLTGIRSKYFFLIHVDDQKKGNQMKNNKSVTNLILENHIPV